MLRCLWTAPSTKLTVCSRLQNTRTFDVNLGFYLIIVFFLKFCTQTHLIINSNNFSKEIYNFKKCFISSYMILALLKIDRILYKQYQYQKNTVLYSAQAISLIQPIRRVEVSRFRAAKGQRPNEFYLYCKRTS